MRKIISFYIYKVSVYISNNKNISIIRELDYII